jgi:hypothetical protein
MTWSFVGGRFVEGLAFDVCRICGRQHFTGNRPDLSCSDDALLKRELSPLIGRTVTGDSSPKSTCPDCQKSRCVRHREIDEPPLLTKPGD